MIIDEPPANGAELRTVPIDSIVRAPDNPRGKVSPKDETVVALAESIKLHGVLEPPIVAPFGTDQFLLVAGERRWTACKVNGLTTIEVVVRPDYGGDGAAGDRKVAMLVENLHRDDLAPAAVARGMGELRELGHNQRQIATMVGVSQPAVSKALQILELPKNVQDRVGDDIAAEVVPKLAKLAKHPKLLKEVVEQGCHTYQVDNAVRDLDRLDKIEELKTEAKEKGWAVKVAESWNLPTGTMRLQGNRWDDPLGIPLAKHRKEPCHCAVIKTQGGVELVESCSNPRRHTEKGDSAIKVKDPAQVRLDEKKAQSDKDAAARKGKRVALARREQHLTSALAHRRSIANVLDVLQPFVVQHASTDDARVALRLLGVTTEKGQYLPDVIKKLAEDKPEDVGRIALAVALGRGHAHAAKGGYGWGADVDLVYSFLEGDGYDLDEYERAELARRRCKLCRSEEGEQLAGEVIMLNDDGLCSECTPQKCRVCGRTEDDRDDEDSYFAEDDLCAECQLKLAEGGGPDVEEPGDDSGGLNIEVAAAPGATVSIDLKRGKYVTTCSEHGQVARNTQEDYARERADAHMAEEHGVASVRTCRGCGCTEESGCIEGCTWVELDLCSSCMILGEGAAPDTEASVGDLPGEDDETSDFGPSDEATKEEEAEASDALVPSISLIAKLGKFYIRCSECGHVGVNPKPEDAETRGQVHLKEHHGVAMAGATS